MSAQGRPSSSILLLVCYDHDIYLLFIPYSFLLMPKGEKSLEEFLLHLFRGTLLLLYDDCNMFIFTYLIFIALYLYIYGIFD